MDEIRYAIHDKNLLLVKTLLRHVSRDDVNRTWLQNIFNTLELSHARIVCGYIMDPVDRLNILHIATVSGYTSIVRAILDSKPSLLNTKTEKGFTALQLAIILNQTKTACYLIEKKANLKHTLALAVLAPGSNNTTIPRLLIQNGANVNEKDMISGVTPIFFAKSSSMVQFLVSKGADVNHKDVFGWTPLMALAGLIRVDKELLYSTPLDMMKTFVQQGANISLRGRNRESVLREKKITLLHAVAHGLGKHTPGEMFHIYEYICSEFLRKNIRVKPKTTLGNTPLLYLIQYMKKRVTENTATESMKRDFTRVFSRVSGMFYDTVPMDRNNNGKSVQYHLRSMMNEVIFPQNFVSRYIGSTTNNAPNKINNIHIPNNLNRTDPITINAVNINNAYIIKKDLQNKNINKNGRRVRVKEVKTVYNKSSLNALVASGRSLVSPMSRRPFTPLDIVKLSAVAPARELNRYKNSNRR